MRSSSAFKPCHPGNSRILSILSILSKIFPLDAELARSARLNPSNSPFVRGRGFSLPPLSHPPFRLRRICDLRKEGRTSLAAFPLALPLCTSATLPCIFELQNAPISGNLLSVAVKQTGVFRRNDATQRGTLYERAGISYSVPHALDREWYRTFQQFRRQLVLLIDRLLNLLELDPEFKHFHLDGQTIVLEDYLALRPENENAWRA